MQVGLVAPQGWKGEYEGWDPAAAWARTVELARHVEEIGFESLWVFDHFLGDPAGASFAQRTRPIRRSGP